jgi:hypothetical protein
VLRESGGNLFVMKSRSGSVVISRYVPVNRPRYARCAIACDLTAVDSKPLAARAVELAFAFDPDREASALIYNEAEDWLDRRGGTPARFPELEHNYRNDAEAAAAQEAYRRDEGLEDDW